MVWCAGHGLFGHGASREVVAHISGCTCSHLDRRIWMRDQENMAPPSVHIIVSKLSQVHLLELIKKQFVAL
jgi:hypothetical protein